MNGPYTVVIIIKAKKGKEVELKKILTGLVDPSKKEAGCTQYTLHHDPKDPSRFMFYENFVDQKAHESHCETSHIRSWEAKMDDLLAEPFDVMIWEKLL